MTPGARRYRVAHGKQDQLQAPLEGNDHPWLQNPSVSHASAITPPGLLFYAPLFPFCSRSGALPDAQVGSITAMTCFANGGMTYLASGDEHGTLTLWRVL